MQLVEQHGSGGEGGGEIYREDMRIKEILLGVGFFPPKRDWKLSDGEQQEAKRPKSPEREGVQLAEQHGSGDECGEEMQTDMREILWNPNPVVGFGSGSGSTRPFSYPGLGSARRQQHFK